MPKPRTKRSHIREERKRKRLEEEESSHYDKKRQRHVDGDNNGHQGEQYGGDGDGYGDGYGEGGFPGAEKEFFGMLADEEQEYFRRADEMLELNQFPSRDERDVFLQSVFHEARGKELKLASSQSCSRLMERLIQLSGTAQKKHLFEAFAGHFLSLVQHRFASHCCEALFLRSAGVVTQELAGFVVDTKGAKGADSIFDQRQQDGQDQQQEPEQSMESLFLATLDELEGGLGYLLTDRFASHTLRVLLMVLSGRPLEDASARTLMKSRKKENVSVVGAAAADEQNQGARAVPASFLMAAGKIIRDSTAGMDATALRVLATHPIGNPTLQLLLELDLTLNKGEKKKKKKNDNEESKEEGGEDSSPGLLSQLLPGAPQSLADPTSVASEFINGMVYDQIGSRLIETLVAHAPGKIFKTLNQHTFLPRIQGYVRNDISCYPAIKVLSRLSREDLVSAVGQIAPTVPQLVAKARYNVLRTLFERCAARGAGNEIKKLMRGLKEGCGPRPVDLVTTLCGLSTDDDDDNDDNDDEEKKKKKKNDNKKKTAKDVAQLTRNEYAIRSHGAQLLTSLLSIPGPCKAVHEALSALPAPQLAQLAMASMPSVTLLTSALATPSPNAAFQKTLVDALTPRVGELAASQYGHNLVNAVAEIPSRGRDRSVPPHKKDAVMAGLAAREAALRESWMGRSVWRAWRGDMWKTRRGDWKAWMREIEDPAPAVASGANGQQPRREKKEAKKDKERQHTATKDLDGVEGQAVEEEGGDVEMKDDAAADGPEEKPVASRDEAKKAEGEEGEGEGEGEGAQDEKKKKKRRRKQKDKKEEEGAQEDTEMKDD